MKHAFHPDAYAEYEEAIRYYAERDPEVASRFIAAIDDAIERIIDEDVRRCLTHIFPYAVLYTVEADYTLILAIMHWRRQPSSWKDRR